MRFLLIVIILPSCVLYGAYRFGDAHGWFDRSSDVYGCTHENMWRHTTAPPGLCDRILSHGWTAEDR
jgi:hypothetical protein